MKKYFLAFLALIMAGVVIGQTQVTDSSAVIHYDFGSSLKDFLSENWKALGAVLLFFISEWIGETDFIPEGSIWRKVINWILSLAKKQVTKSPKMKKIAGIYEKEISSKKPSLDFSKSFKFIIFGLVLSGLSLSTSAQKTYKYRWYPFSKKNVVLAGETVNADLPLFSKDSTLWFGPSIAFDVFSKETKTGTYSIGVIPGVGYGVKWNPFNWERNYLLGIDAFVHAAMSNTDIILDESGVAQEVDTKYFNIKLVPTFTLLNWIHIGYGPLFKIGLDGTEGYIDKVFVFGVTKEF